MGDLNRLSKGFVNWQGERVFVPWLGSLRIVPSAQDEVRILKLRYRAHIVMAIGFVPILLLVGIVFGLLAAAFGPPAVGDHSVLAVMVCIVIVFGLCGRIERKLIDAWPILPTSRRAFLLDYYCALPTRERLEALVWNGVGAVICLSAFVHYIGTLSPVSILCALVGPLPLGIVTGEHVAACVRALLRTGAAPTLPVDAGRP
jgi:hypothetical protein